MALGATPSKVLRMILLEALTLLAWGMLLGAAGLFFAMRFVESMLHEVSAYDLELPLSFSLQSIAIPMRFLGKPRLVRSSQAVCEGVGTNRYTTVTTVDITKLSATSIEGRTIIPSKDSKLDCETGTFTKLRNKWEEFVWIPQ
jgi:hypothetical protein